MKRRVLLSLVLTLFIGFLFAQVDVEELKRQANAGDSEAQYTLGVMYTQGQGVAENMTEAIRLLRLSAAQNHLKAMYTIGLCYYYGQGIALDYKEAVRWFKTAANKGESNSQYYLGICYDNGQGVAKDYKESYKWSLLASIYCGDDYYDNAENNRELARSFLTATQIEQAEAEALLIRQTIESKK